MSKITDDGLAQDVLAVPMATVGIKGQKTPDSFPLRFIVNANSPFPDVEWILSLLSMCLYCR